MKFILFFIGLFLLFSGQCLQIKLVKRSRDLNSYITNLGIGEIPGMVWEQNKPLKSKVDGGATDITQITGDLATITTDKIQKIVSWEEVKKAYIKAESEFLQKLLKNLNLF